MTCRYCSCERRPEDAPNPYPEGTFAHQWEDFANAMRRLNEAADTVVERHRDVLARRAQRRRAPHD